MLASEAKNLRWMGIDMAPRWRRRVAVLATYFVFVALTGAAVSFPPDSAFSAAHPTRVLLALVLVSTLWLYLSVFRPGGVVKSFEDAPSRFGKEPWFLASLDAFARYRHGLNSFDEATEEQKEAMLHKIALFGRTTETDGLGRIRITTIEPYGTGSPDLDERELAERDRHSRWALKWLAWALALLAGSVAYRQTLDPPLDTCALLWSFSLLAMTLPQAHVLWIEPDPRAGEQDALQTETDSRSA